ELGWQPAHTFEAAIRETVRWYIEHQDWVQAVLAG
ncbi:MAG: dTDP-glucose 4,6-dehydratase, partial [Deltaproteobacteria bacterium]